MGLFFCSLAVAALAPVFSIERFASAEQGVVGVNIVLHMIESYLPVGSVLIISLGFSAFIILMSRLHSIRKVFLIAAIVAIDVFVALYISLYFMDLAIYYFQSIVHLALHGHFFILFFMVMFYMTTIAFYVGGFLIFISETRRGIKLIS
jgi:hypothetical protein